jgi:hypothetical protein
MKLTPDIRGPKASTPLGPAHSDQGLDGVLRRVESPWALGSSGGGPRADSQALLQAESRFNHDFSAVSLRAPDGPPQALQPFRAQTCRPLQETAGEEQSDPLEREADMVARHALSAPGHEQGVRESVGRFLGLDFSGVRLHRESAQAQAMGSHGFTRGRDVHLAPGRYRPSLPLGRALIGHELAHVAQQGAAARLPAAGHFGAAVSRLGDTHSSEQLQGGADALRDARSGLSAAPAGMRQRCVAGCARCSDPNERDERAGSTDQPPQPGGGAQPAAAPQPTHAAGPSAGAAGHKVVRLSWTVDDGPTPLTPGMSAALSPRAATWFIMSNQLGSGTARTSALRGLVARQTAGDEIGIHSMHPSVGHAAWFPIHLGSSVPNGYNTTADAMTDLTSFTSELRGQGLRVHFARMPGGELSEVKKYVEDQGGSSSTSRAVASALLSGATPSPAAPATVTADVSLVMSTLRRLNLHLWGGSASGPELTRSSGFSTWEAESSGVPARTNDVVRRFQGVVDNLANGSRTRPGSFIILAHDTTQADVTQAGTNISQMETYATGQGVRVEYYRLADLYRIVRGTAP